MNEDNRQFLKPERKKHKIVFDTTEKDMQDLIKRLSVKSFLEDDDQEQLQPQKKIKLRRFQQREEDWIQSPPGPYKPQNSSFSSVVSEENEVEDVRNFKTPDRSDLQYSVKANNGTDDGELGSMDESIWQQNISDDHLVRRRKKIIPRSKKWPSESKHQATVKLSIQSKRIKKSKKSL